MSKTISITVSEDLFNRLERFRKSKGGLERSGVIQQALTHYLETDGPDPRVVARWKAKYEKFNDIETAELEKWMDLQSEASQDP